VVRVISSCVGEGPQLTVVVPVPSGIVSLAWWKGLALLDFNHHQVVRIDDTAVNYDIGIRGDGEQFLLDDFCISNLLQQLVSKLIPR
jgi:hypothetical protein